MTTRISRDAYGLKLAEAAALRADCSRRQVGAVVIAPDGSIVSTGYNGLAAGLPGCATAGACPRGQMAYPAEPPIAVGDEDTFCAPTRAEECTAEDPYSTFGCTREADHDGFHVASTGRLSPVLAVWPAVGTQEASVGYEATGCRAVHAEVNAILRGRGREGCQGATIYVTDEPCFHCSVVIEGAGIVRVVTPASDPDDHQDVEGWMGRTSEITQVPMEATVAALPPQPEERRTSGPLDPETHAALVRQADRMAALRAAADRRAELAMEHEGWRP